MGQHTGKGSPLDAGRKLLKISENLKGLPGVFLVLLLLIWVGLPLVPEGTGLRFGMGYQVFFTTMTLLGALFFWFLSMERIPQPRGSMGVVASLTAVYLVTIGILVVVGVIYPQFSLPSSAQGTEQDAAKRGKVLFWSETGKAGCFRCHAIAGRGGTRGPDLTSVALMAGDRVAGLAADQYLLEKVRAGMTYRFNVPEYTPMMPPFGQFMSEEEIKDLVAYLLTLK